MWLAKFCTFLAVLENFMKLRSFGDFTVFRVFGVLVKYGSLLAVFSEVLT